MQRYNAEAIYRLGGHLQALRSIEAGATVSQALSPYFHAGWALSNLLQFPGLSLSPGCRQAGAELIRLLNDATWEKDSEGKDVMRQWETKLLPITVIGIQEKVKEFETHFVGDCLELNLYNIPQVQAYNTRVLLEEGEKLLTDTAALKLGKEPYRQALEDTRLAAKCLAFDLWTATGFHIARATEYLLQHYWKTVRGSKALPPKHSRTWVALCRELQGRPATGKKPEVPAAGDQKLVKHLLALGEDYRNPLVHPEHSLDESDGPVLLSACTGAMTKLLAALP